MTGSPLVPLVGAILGFILIAPTILFYFAVIRGVDRYEPEPWWLLTLCFFWGALGSIIMTFVFHIGVGATGLQLSQAANATLLAPLYEETAKGMFLIPLWIASALYLKELDGPLDGLIYGGVIGLGFTFTEDILYVSGAFVRGGLAGLTFLFILRTILGGLGHATFTAMTGLGVGIASDTRFLPLKLIAPIVGWSAAVFLHALHNGLLSYLGGLGVVAKFLFFWTFDVLFFIVLYALALRDRTLLIQGLRPEVGRLLSKKEFDRTVSILMLLPFWNTFSLWDSPGGSGKARRKQLDLVDLAFTRRRISHGENLTDWEHQLVHRIQDATAAGVLIGKP